MSVKIDFGTAMVGNKLIGKHIKVDLEQRLKEGKNSNILTLGVSGAGKTISAKQKIKSLLEDNKETEKVAVAIISDHMYEYLSLDCIDKVGLFIDVDNGYVLSNSNKNHTCDDIINTWNNLRQVLRMNIVTRDERDKFLRSKSVETTLETFIKSNNELGITVYIFIDTFLILFRPNFLTSILEYSCSSENRCIINCISHPAFLGTQVLELETDDAYILSLFDIFEIFGMEQPEIEKVSNAICKDRKEQMKALFKKDSIKNGEYIRSIMIANHMKVLDIDNNLILAKHEIDIKKESKKDYDTFNRIMGD